MHVLGVPIAPGSLFVYTVTASTVALVVLMPIVGAFADRTGRKRDIMLGCGWAGRWPASRWWGSAAPPGSWGAVLFALAFLGANTTYR